ncbi:methylmalonyl-CoA mutase [Fibrella sp. USSR17]
MPTSFPSPFPPATHADWLNQVQKDLKDSTVYESLRWASPEGFTVEPYYTAEQTASLDYSTLQISQKSTPGWLSAPSYFAGVGQEKHINAILRDALTNGADALVVDVPGGEISVARLLDGIKLSTTPVYFRLAADVDSAHFLQTLRQIAPYQLRGGILTSLPASISAIADLISQSTDSPNFRTIGVSGHDFHSAGATATQELAFTLARLAETYASLGAKGLAIEPLVAKTIISVSVGTSYFMEMAKLRALRVLLSRMAPAAAGPGIQLHAQTSTFYEAAATPYTNLLRTTTEAMAAVIGGADVLTVRPYDAVLHNEAEDQPGEFSHRIARNVSTMLKAESYLDKVADPAAGSYYIETLTHQLTEAAWVLFQQVQEQGGLTTAMETGYVQQELARSYDAKVEAIQNGRVLVGVTKFRHDEAGDEAAKAVYQSISPVELPARRLASEFE